MGRTSKAVTSGLLICALAAVTVPAGLHLIPAFLPQNPAAVAVLPAAQEMPTAIGSISGVTPLAGDAPLPDAAKLATDLQQSLTFDGEGTFSVYVADALTGQKLYSQKGEAAATPASNLKLLTAAAALETLGPETRFSTRAVAGSSPEQLVLVAGGDAMLSDGGGDTAKTMGHAGLEDLARQTAMALATAGVKGPVTLSIDDTLFTGPALNPDWADGDVDAGEIAPIFPMALNAGRLAPEVLSGPRPQDSAVAAAEAFAHALEAAGVSTTGAISRAKAPLAANGSTAGAVQPGTVLGSVESATVAQQVQYMLAESDNYVAEVMGRMAALKLGKEASNSGAIAAVREVVESLGVSLDGITMTDACGLAVGNLISPAQLVKVLTLMLADPGSNIGLALPGLPIAGLSGSLQQRFVSGPELGGAGLVRAKTGSLNSVTGLSGYVVNAHGRLLVFSILGNGFSDGAAAARPVADAAAAVLAGS